ncbi:hypothetical protein FRUB_01541 [Fimbriiglobus ruber]|uniref:Uncharacterized protein n=1 Tax=Fimbriiglobus ruber TaxID=1908690 RepID=A0A225DUM1_9BACT|nr:hypothetical protein FRUB_01541 [Fimbriiglobus ruber]
MVSVTSLLTSVVCAVCHAAQKGPRKPPLEVIQNQYHSAFFPSHGPPIW